MGFFALAATAFLGGTAHAVAGSIRPQVQQRIWRASLIGMGVASWLMFDSAIVATVREADRAWLLGLAFLLLAAHGARVIQHPRLGQALAVVALAWSGIAALQVYAFVGWHAPSAPPILAGIAIAGSGAWLQRRQLTLHARFNHNDLFHLLLLIALWFFYRGGLLLTDRLR